jgi:parallel beta-helix repeat protein
MLGVNIGSTFAGDVDVKSVSSVGFDGNTLYVGGSGPNNYTTIQSAINYAVDGDTVFVYDDSSPYNENVVVDKSINLIGENKETTIIDAGGTDDSVYISADGVTITGFTMRNSGTSWFPDYDAGVDIRSDYNTIFNNIMTENNYNGIYILNSSNSNVISVNSITNNSHSGILLMGSSSNVITGNTVANHGGDCISMWESSNDNTVSGNTITDGGRGIVMWDCTGNNIIMNTIMNNDWGIEIRDLSYNNIYHNKFIDNGMNAYEASCDNQWDNGYPSGGNYWDDYTGLDQFSGPNQNQPGPDGIGDVPHTIQIGNSHDEYPLVLDKVPPNIAISAPEKALYINNEKIRAYLFRIPIILGDIYIAVNVSDALSGVERVEFYINGQLKETVTSPPYTYKWLRERIRLFFHMYLIEVVAYDKSGNVARDQIIVRKFF